MVVVVQDAPVEDVGETSFECSAGFAGCFSFGSYEAGGTFVGITDGTGTTVTLGSITAHVTTPRLTGL
ncbi:hypothetical protein [Arthrobacter sp. NA-172]|uniref:hypothetical protein n=1 Tax=Arthrobacter sp. NA-172 TaxID=3367524 RepID=UPI0037544A92